MIPRLLVFPTVAGILAALALSSCDTPPNSGIDASGRRVVFVSVAPLATLVKRIGGDRVVVETLAGPEQDPHGFSPTPRQLVALGESAAFFVVGMPFEKRLVEKLSDTSKGLRVIDVTGGIEKLELDEHHHHDHEHDHDHGHAHHDEDMGDPHVWLSPALLKQQAVVIEHALHDLDPEGHDVFHRNLEALLADLDTLDAELRAALAPLKGSAFYVYHGAFGYFAKAYDLKQEAIEMGGRSPEPKRVFELIEAAKAEGIKLVLVQPQFDTHSAEAIAEGIGGTVVPVNPMEEDVFATLRLLGEKVRAARE